MTQHQPWKRLAILLAVMGALVGVPSAQAGWKVERATAIAGIVWQHPCAGLRVEWVDQAYVSDASARWAATASDCTVIINRSNGPLAFEELCSLVVHEAGHLAGYRDPTNVADPAHSSNPASVMSADATFVHSARTVGKRRIDRWSGVDRRCLDRGRPYLKAHGVL